MPSPKQCTGRRRLLLVAALAAVVLLAGCTRTPETLEIVVPAGTNDRIAAGEVVDVMPAVIELRVGDTLAIRNEDSVTHLVGPYVVYAGADVSFTYGSAGRFEGLCPLSSGNTYEIIVRR